MRISAGSATRFLLSALACAASLHAGAQAPDEGAGVRLLVQSSPLAGFRYGEAAGVWPQMRQGDALELVREPANPHDPNAVRVEWRGRKLGYVPRAENGALAWAMDRGETLKARISRLTEHRNPRKRIEFEVILE
jgi:hypothetical protein